MKYNQVKELSEELFRRLTGVKKATFKRMSEILREADAKKKAKGGRKSKLSIEDQLLMVNFGAPYVKDGVSRIINGIL